MDKTELANQLRERQIKKGLLKQSFKQDGYDVDDDYIRNLVYTMSDDEIIDSYISCPQCKEKEVNDEELASAISLASDVETFFNILDHKELLS